MAEHLIAHCEIPTTDLDRAKDFYHKVLGWEFKPFGHGYLLYRFRPCWLQELIASLNSLCDYYLKHFFGYFFCFFATYILAIVPYASSMGFINF